MKAGNQTLLKKNNQRAIVNYIIENGPFSRADLSKKLNISKPTVSANIAELLDLDLLKEIGYSETEIGKKPMLVDFNKHYKFILALDFISYYTQNKTNVALCNLYSEVVFNETIDLGENFTKATMMEFFPKELNEIINRNNIDINDIGIFVLTAPTAVYDSDHIRFECGDGEIINLAEVFINNFPHKRVVKNDINLAALGEKYFGVGKKVDTLAFVWAGVAVGGGIILNGELYEGKMNSGGELAFTTVYNELEGKYVFLHEILSYSGIHDFVNHYKAEAEKSSIADKLFSKKLSLDALITAAHNGDEFCLKYAKFIAQKMTEIICNMSATFDLEMVIVGGEFSRFGHIFIDEITARIDEMPLTQTQITTPMFSHSAMFGAFKFGSDYIIEHLI